MAPEEKWSAQGELLRPAPVAVIDLQPGAVGRVAARRVQAAARLRVEQRTVRLLLPDLTADPVAGPQLDLGAAGRPVAVDVEAAAQGAQRAVGLVHPVLVDRVRLAVPQ